MKIHVPLARRFPLAAIAALLVLHSFARAQTTQSSTPRKIDRPLNLLVLGDSISWGQGLKDEHKAWYLVKSWLQQNTGREVRERIEAHSGAVIRTRNTSEAPASFDINRQLSRAYPTIHGQLDYALKMFVDPATVDLVIVDGCINDLDSRRLLNAANTPDGIRELAQAKCGPPVEALLIRITNVFPKAHVVVTGYYPILSEKSANDFFIRALAKRFYSPEVGRSEEHTSELQSRRDLVCRLLLEKKNKKTDPLLTHYKPPREHLHATTPAHLLLRPHQWLRFYSSPLCVRCTMLTTFSLLNLIPVS